MENKYRYCFFGDSITDGVNSKRRFTEYLQEMTDADIRNYGVNGAQSVDLLSQFAHMEQEIGEEYDCAVIFIGTNDFFHGISLGDWFSETSEQVPTGLDDKGKPLGYCTRKKRSFIQNETTFCGRMNTALSYLREKHAEKRIVLITPIHRGFAFFGGTNYQPEELYSNPIGEYLEAYVGAVRQAADIWSCELIDLYRNTGFFPMAKKNAELYFYDIDRDRLHPNAEGHKRMADLIWADLSRYEPKSLS